MVDNLRGEFDPHRHLRREASVRQYNGAGMFCPQFYLRAEPVLLIYNAQINYTLLAHFYTVGLPK
jgi:hypothetical protein